MTQWIRDEKRAKIYTRDTPDGQVSPACIYCGRAVLLGRTPSDSDGGLAAATLDHVNPAGGNGAKNLVTCCWDCNTSKGKRTPAQWERHGNLPRWRSKRPKPAETIAERVALAVARPLFAEQACSLKVRATDDRRVAGAEASRRRR